MLARFEFLVLGFVSCCGPVVCTAAAAGAAVSAAVPFPISVINLDKDTARLAAVRQSLERSGVPEAAVERLSAVYGKTLSDEELRENTTRLARLFATRGMIGCYLSHRCFWERTLARPEPWAVVLEDDVVLAEDFCGQVARAVAELEACPETAGQWDVLLLGALGCVEPNGKYGWNRFHAFCGGGGRRARRVTASTIVPRRPFGTHAYALSRRGAAKLLTRASLAAYHVDAVAWGVGDLSLLCCAPMLAHQAFDAPSTIGAVLGGLEVALPNLVVDPYTRVTLPWAFNEPVLRVPVLGVLLTVGRAMLFIGGGFLAAAAAALFAVLLRASARGALGQNSNINNNGDAAAAAAAVAARTARLGAAAAWSAWAKRLLVSHTVTCAAMIALCRALVRPHTTPTAASAVAAIEAAVQMNAAAEAVVAAEEAQAAARHAEDAARAAAQAAALAEDQAAVVDDVAAAAAAEAQAADAAAAAAAAEEEEAAAAESERGD